MRYVLATLFAAAVVCAASYAQAERRMFIIANNADGYGVDRCLAGGEKCGAAVAQAYCKSHEFAEAASFRKIDRDDITGSIPTSGPGACRGGKCDEFVAIVCTR
jgi:hypothetical protein